MIKLMHDTLEDRTHFNQNEIEQIIHICLPIGAILALEEAAKVIDAHSEYSGSHLIRELKDEYK